MTLSPTSLLDRVLIGNDAGWLLSFYRERGEGSSLVIDEENPVLEIGRDDYYADIRAALPGGLEGGIYTFVIEGMTDEHYAAIAQRGDGSPKVVKLFLYWRDTNASPVGYLKNIASLTDTLGNVTASDIPDALVAVLNIVSVSRKAGARRYETTVKARERVFDILQTNPLDSAPEPSNHLEMAGTVSSNYGVQVETHELSGGTEQAEASESPGSEEQELEVGVALIETLRELGRRMEESTGKYGRGMFLIRDGTLHIGERPFPLEGETMDLTLGKGLIEVEALASIDLDAGTGSETTSRRQFKLTCKGRPDLKPGDMVQFDLPDEEVAANGPSWTGIVGELFSGPLVPSLGDTNFRHPMLIYVVSVEHDLGRTRSFKTEITGVEIQDENQVWDSRTRRHVETEEGEEPGSAPEQQAARRLRRHVRRAIGNRRFAEVGEVRRMTTEGTDEPPNQTLTVWRGLAPPDGRANQARRLPVQRPSPAPVSGVPYTTPFAWGKCGLVLPRYPGTRVLVAHRNGRRNDPIDIGALWESGHGPDTRPGDWWLILPVGIPESERATIADDEEPEEHNEDVTQDLIDADGNRIIEVGELTIRVGRDSLKNAGDRPERCDETDSITIEHTAEGSKIVMKQDGTVVIEAKNIEIKAEEDINMEASNINVNVSGAMDVS